LPDGPRRGPQRVGGSLPGLIWTSMRDTEQAFTDYAKAVKERPEVLG
jgi:hypothetical protein